MSPQINHNLRVSEIAAAVRKRADWWYDDSDEAAPEPRHEPLGEAIISDSALLSPECVTLTASEEPAGIFKAGNRLES